MDNVRYMLINWLWLKGLKQSSVIKILKLCFFVQELVKKILHDEVQHPRQDGPFSHQQGIKV